MKKTTLLLAGTALSLLGSTAFAQVLGDSAVDNRIETLNDDINDDFERDDRQFGNSGRALGYDGSLALQANATSGNTDTATLGLGANMGYYDGTNGYEITLSYQYSENDSTVDEDSLLYDLEYTRDFGAAYYGFAKLQGTIESIPFDTTDNFLGFGVGYKIYDTRDIQWSVQGGVGYRVADLNTASDLNEGALSLSSNYSNQINETLAITNDTDIIGSESDTVVYNDLGFNVSMTETLALRTSLVTEYHTDPAPGKDDTDNAFGVSLVYNFN
jgi:putative salt-induced outer membrane protein